MFEEKYLIKGKRYTMQNLLDVWEFFKEKGYPTSAGLSKELCFKRYYHSAFLAAKGKTGLEYASKAHDNLDIDALFWEVNTFFNLWKQAEVKLALKDRKPLTEEEFRAGEYEKYLKDFEEETKRLEELASKEI